MEWCCWDHRLQAPAHQKDFSFNSTMTLHARHCGFQFPSAKEHSAGQLLKSHFYKWHESCHYFSIFSCSLCRGWVQDRGSIKRVFNQHFGTEFEFYSGQEYWGKQLAEIKNVLCELQIRSVFIAYIYLSAIDFTAYTNNNTNTLLDIWITEGRYSKSVSLHMLWTVSKGYRFPIIFSWQQINPCIEAQHHIVYRNCLMSLQHISSLPKHGSLILFHMNFQHEKCQFSLIAFTYWRCWNRHKLQITICLLEQYRRQFKLSIYHLPYDHLEHQVEIETGRMEVAQFNPIAQALIVRAI